MSLRTYIQYNNLLKYFKSPWKILLNCKITNIDILSLNINLFFKIKTSNAYGKKMCIRISIIFKNL